MMANRICFSQPLWRIVAISVVAVVVFLSLRTPIPDVTYASAIPNAFKSQATHSPSKNPKIALVSFITQQKSYLHLSLKNKQFYTQRHGYDFIVDFDSHSSRGTTWLKLDMVERTIRQGDHDWVWYLDFDTLITNTTAKLEDVIFTHLANMTNPESIDILLTNDCNDLNDGSFILKKSQNSLDFLDGVRNYYDRQDGKGHQWSDQDAMHEYILSSPPLSKHISFLPQHEINAFPEEIGCYDDYRRKWEHGMLAIHFAGAWAHVKEEDPTGFLMNKYEGEIIWE